MLAAGKDKFRIVMRGYRDTIELSRVEDNWISDGEKPVVFEALLMHEDMSAFCSELYPLTQTAGGSTLI